MSKRDELLRGDVSEKHLVTFIVGREEDRDKAMKDYAYLGELKYVGPMCSVLGCRADIIIILSKSVWTSRQIAWFDQCIRPCLRQNGLLVRG